MKIVLKRISYTLAAAIFLSPFASCRTENIIHPVKKEKVSGVTASKKNNPQTFAKTCHCFYEPEQYPKFPGGAVALKQYLSNHVHYPESAAESGISGTIVVQFLIDTTGALSRISTVGRKRGHGLEQEAVRVVKAMPHWIPGTVFGKKVAVQYSLPVRFVLQ